MARSTTYQLVRRVLEERYSKLDEKVLGAGGKPLSQEEEDEARGKVKDEKDSIWGTKLKNMPEKEREEYIKAELRKPRVWEKDPREAIPAEDEYEDPEFDKIFNKHKYEKKKENGEDEIDKFLKDRVKEKNDEDEAPKATTAKKANNTDMNRPMGAGDDEEEDDSLKAKSTESKSSKSTKTETKDDGEEDNEVSAGPKGARAGNVYAGPDGARAGDVYAGPEGAGTRKSSAKKMQEHRSTLYNVVMRVIEEGRGRPRKNPNDPKWQKKPANGEESDEMEGLQPDSGKEADQHIHVRLKTAADGSEKGGADITFDNNKKHFVKQNVAKTVLSALDKMKPEARNQVHGHIAQSHENLMQVHSMLTGKKQ